MYRENWSKLSDLDEENIDAHVFEHNGNVILVMTPYVARIIGELTGCVTGSGPKREAINTVWDVFDTHMPIDPDDYELSGSGVHVNVNREDEDA